jgi:hypothetical protein
VPKELATLDGDVCAILIIEAQLICQAAGNDPADSLRERRDRLLNRLGVAQIEQLLQIVSSLNSVVAPVRPQSGAASTPTSISDGQVGVLAHSKEIDAFLAGDAAIDAELWSIDENLMRAELSPADEAAYLARQKQLWEIKRGATHPTPGHGDPGRALMPLLARTRS